MAKFNASRFYTDLNYYLNNTALNVVETDRVTLVLLRDILGQITKRVETLNLEYKWLVNHSRWDQAIAAGYAVWPSPGLIEFAKTTLLTNAQIALTQNKELNIDKLGMNSRFFANLQKDGIIQVDLSITDGGIPIVTVNILMDEYCGTIEDYATAVTTAREDLNYGYKLEGNQATWVWYQKLYRSARENHVWVRKTKEGWEERPVETAGYIRFYWKIWAERLNAVLSKSPWWYLLENGGGEVKLNSDRGGYDILGWIPTHFVEKSKNEIKNFIENRVEEVISEILNQNADEERTLQDELNALDKAERIVTNAMDSFRVTVPTYKTTINMVSVKINHLQQVQNILEEVFAKETKSDYAFDRIEIVAGRLAVGDIPASQRMYLGTFAGRQRYIRVKRLLADIKKEKEERNLTLNKADIRRIVDVINVDKARIRSNR